MNNDTLNDCMKISIDGPVMQDFDFDSAVKKWSKLKNRCTPVSFSNNCYVLLYNRTVHGVYLIMYYRVYYILCTFD